MVEPYEKFLPACHVPNSYGKMVPPATPYGKTIPPRASPPYLGPLANLANVATLRGYGFTNCVACRVIPVQNQVISGTGLLPRTVMNEIRGLYSTGTFERPYGRGAAPRPYGPLIVP